ncbi:trans-4-hydroxy-L-proline dehydratase [Desulforamulus hydrothermalis]|uniref:Putative formate acetyltransferase 2 (Pyruvate formate lyase II) n=1 Tax=Desulforamulus hydrothermalis Lam5 = DSM 18033 TaxID=1121428 RepID=K8EEC7_9FIRM|nr:trans-4-hydroxy-L-proline dehydratase [Desulforamulus hydrothermalis]CCO07146.1 putative formate acetyltransferase 2 (pyruvate formate lyase II) [Desulforamulus hydrothermalis Lam5 = DSM 18033]SHG89075.1 formate C-acetyltransferase [Desulforamulus hydrothermalis Lam5 = DSM 18033]
MVERGMNERIRRLRQQSVTTEPSISMERAVLVTEAYQRYAGTVEIPILRALTFKHIMANKTLCILDGELIVGEKGEGPQAAPTYPELCCHTLEDFEIMHRREKISYKVSEQAKRIQAAQIIPYWQERSLRKKIFDHMSPRWHACYNAGIFTEFMEQRAPGHTVADGKIYEKGFLDFQKEIMQAIASLDFLNDAAAYEKKVQLTAMKICCDAIMIYGRRYAEYAKKLAACTDDPQRRQELLEIAANCEVVPAHRPQTFAQALQMYWFVHIGVTSELNNWDAFSPGRLDQHLYPFYQKGLADGSLTKEKAKELLSCLWIKFNNQPAPPKVGITLQESGTYTDFANINSGGVKADGSDGVNDVTYLILDVMEELRLLQPSSNVQISRKSPHRFVKRACEIARQGWGQPAMYNTDAIIQELLRAGKDITDARAGGASGCVEAGAFGKEAYILTGYFNLPKILELTLNNGFDKLSGQQLGLPTGYAVDFKSYEELFAAFKKQINYFADIKIAGNHIIEQLYATQMPCPFLSVLISDCIEKGKDYNAGGARYNTSYIQGVGIGTLTDCLAAIKYNVFDHQRFTMQELMQALAANFEGCQDLRHLVLNKTPKYGNDDDYADQIMTEAFHAFYEAVNGRPNTKGGVYRIDMLPTTCHVYFGSVTGATPNGRLAGKPLSEGISPEQGADRRGPTAVLKSAAKMDHLRTGGTLLNQKFNPAAVAGEEGLQGMAALVRTYFNLDGHHIQFNVIDRQTLLEARQRPEEYKDLIVRVAGYSDYFHNLSKELQDEIIARTEHNSLG